MFIFVPYHPVCIFLCILYGLPEANAVIHTTADAHSDVTHGFVAFGIASAHQAIRVVYTDQGYHRSLSLLDYILNHHSFEQLVNPITPGSISFDLAVGN